MKALLELLSIEGCEILFRRNAYGLEMLFSRVDSQGRVWKCTRIIPARTLHCSEFPEDLVEQEISIAFQSSIHDESR